MAQVTREADQDVFDLLDSQYVEEHVQDDVYIIFACVAPDNRKDDTWVSDDGKPSYLITLPYSKVKGMQREEVRDLMLSKAKERLAHAA